MIAMENQIEKTVEWLKEKVSAASAEGLILGVSGGIDSAVCAFLNKKAFPENSLGLILPCKSDPQDVKDALSVTRAIGLAHHVIDLSAQHDQMFGVMVSSLKSRETTLSADRKRVADANLRARLRMSILYSFANALNYLVVGTDNAAELYTGYFTKYGDGAVDVMPIANLSKRMVRQWAEKLGVPNRVIEKAPSAGLWEGQTDEEELGISYDVIDDYLEGKTIQKSDEEIIERLNRITQHKRETPPKPPLFHK